MELAKKQAVYSMANNHLSESRHFAYNEKGMLTEETFKNAGGDLIRKIQFSYNEAGQRIKIEKTDFWIRERKETFSYSYNEQGKLLQVLWEIDGKEKGKMTYEYDEEGKMLQRIVKNS